MPTVFKFSYIDRLPEPPSPPATKGTLVHRALELLMCRPQSDRTIDAALIDLETAGVEMVDDPDLAGLELTDEQRGQFDADAEELVRKYFLLEDPRTVRPNGLELKLTAQFGRVTLRGIIDRLEIDDDGEFVVTDYKTGSVPSEFAENARLSGVHIYAALCEQMLGKRPARVQLYYLSKPEAIIATPTEQSVAGVGGARTPYGRPSCGPASATTPTPYRSALRLLHLQAVLPRFRRRSRASGGVARPGHHDRAQPPARRQLTAPLTPPPAPRPATGASRWVPQAQHVEVRVSGRRSRSGTSAAAHRASPTPTGSGAQGRPSSANPRGSRSTSACA